MTAGERIMAFLDEGIVGFAALAFGLIVVVPMLPFIAVGWVFSRVAARIEARSDETAKRAQPEGREPDTAAQKAPA